MTKGLLVFIKQVLEDGFDSDHLNQVVVLSLGVF